MSGKKQGPQNKTGFLPPGVSCAYVNKEGKEVYILDPFLKDMRWEGLTITSLAFKGLPSHKRLYKQSRAFLHAAIVLCEDAGESGQNLEWSKASVCYYCLHLATELFLKACLICMGEEPKKLHEIADILERYRDLLPDKEFYWPTPWYISAKDLENIFGHEVLQGVDRTPDQLYRYGMDKKGTSSAGVQLFNPGYFFNYVKHLDIKWSEIWEKVQSRMDK